MGFSRRGFLQRLPAVPFGIGAAVSQVPNIGKWFQGNGYPPLTPVTESTIETRIVWFRNSMEWVDRMRPTVAMPAADASLTAEDVRVIFQWEQWIQRVMDLTKSYDIPLETASKIVGVELH